jgi:hypothetical protein
MSRLILKDVRFMSRAYSVCLLPEHINSQQCYYVSMSNSFDKRPTSQPTFTGLFDWSRAHLYLSLANMLAALIAIATTIEVIENCIHVNQLELGVLAIPFIACLDILFIALVTSLFVRKPGGFCLYLGFAAILFVPNVASIIVVDVLHGLSGINNVPNQATSRLIESSSIFALSILYFWDIVNRMREARRYKVA